jgi:hypothetical protein
MGLICEFNGSGPCREWDFVYMIYSWRGFNLDSEYGWVICIYRQYVRSLVNTR